MRQSVPLSWIEQAEAAQVLNNAEFCRAPTPVSRRPFMAASIDRLSQAGARIAEHLLATLPVPQTQPAMARANARRAVQRCADYDDFSRCG